MANKSLQHSSLTDNIFYRSMLAGNDAFFPESESDDFLEEVVLSSSASSVTFSSLGTYATAGYKHLQIRWVCQVTYGLQTVTIKMTVNGTNFAAGHQLRPNGSSVVSAGYTSDNPAYEIGKVIDSTYNSNGFGAGLTEILDFSSTSKNTTVRTLWGAASSSSPLVGMYSNLYNSTTAVTSLSVSSAYGNLNAGSRFSLYGSKG